MTAAERSAFAFKIYPLAKQLHETPSSRHSIQSIYLTKQEYAHAKYLEYNMRYFTQHRVKRAA